MASSTSASKHSRPALHATPTSTVSAKATLTGKHPITLSPRCVINPFARLDTSQGPITIGEAAIVWEGAHIGSPSEDLRHASDAIPKEGSRAAGEDQEVNTGADTDNRTVLEARVSVQARAVVESGARIGTAAVVDVAARVGAGAVVGEYAKIATGAIVAPGEIIAPFAVVLMDAPGAQLGSEERSKAITRRINETLKSHPQVREMQDQGHERHVELLQKLVKSSTT